VRVFVSHSGKDLWVAQHIAADIRRCGASTFLDEADIAHGDDFDDEILKAEEQCRELLVLLTPWSLDRPYIWLEIGYFRKGRKRIVAVLYGLGVEEASSDPCVLNLLKRLDMVDLNGLDSYLEQLRKRVGG
jgi:TIR domain